MANEQAQVRATPTDTYTGKACTVARGLRRYVQQGRSGQ